MQTFLPYDDFAESAASLDRQRLGKQRVENLQIIKALTLDDYGWQNHPATKMWDGYLGTLVTYQEAICNEWTGRGYKDTCLDKTYDLVGDMAFIAVEPPWLGDEELHRSHQSNLIRKDPEHYRPIFGDDVPDNLEYVWPTK